MKTAAGVTYKYDGDGRRVSKSSGKLYWYGSGGDILAETDASGNTTAEYIFFSGKRIAMLPAGGNPIYYVEDLLGTSRVITTNTGVVCYDADFYPYGAERAYTNTCPQNYKFEGKERDTETGNDDFGARYYSNRFGRWLSADWSSVPVPVPYANLTNPQTLNLYAMVSDDPESFADLDGHGQQGTNPDPSSPQGPSSPCPSNLGISPNSGGCNKADQATVANDEKPQPAQKPAESDKKDETQHIEQPKQADQTDNKPQGNQTSTQDQKKDEPPTPAGAGGGRKGERKWTRRPEKEKKVQPNPHKPGRWRFRDPQTGKWKDKPLGWQPTSETTARAIDTATKITVIGILTQLIIELATGGAAPPQPVNP